MSTITNNIFSTVSMLADKAIASFKPDKSVTGIITSTSKDLEGVYGVQVNSTNFTAKSIGNEQYNIGDVVYLLIPDNDLSNMKFILGSTNKKSSNLTEENSIDKEFSFLGSGIIINKYKGKDNPDIVFTPSTTSSTPVEKTKWVTTSITKKGEDSSRVVYATTQIYLPDIANEDLTINQMKVTVSTGGSIILSDLKLLQMTIDNIGDQKYNLTYYFNDNVASGGYDNPATAVSFEITYSGYEYESEIIYSYNKGVKNPHKNIVDTEVFYDDLAALESKFKDDTTAFIVSADFKSNYLNIQTGGVFGIKVKIKYTDGEREYIFSSSEMQAENVYMMLDYTEQKKAFENINNETFEYISEISIFNTMGSGLGVKNLKIYGAKRVASSIPTYTLSIDSVTGVTDISNLEASNITLKAVLKDPSQKVIQNATYTWYQENVTVEDGASEKGGAGWAPLLDNNIDNELTISSSSQFTSASCRFKCIATTSSGMSFDAYYTLYNKNGINLSLTRKDNTLTCEVKQGEVIVDSGLKYKWQRKLNNSSTWIDIDNESNSWDVTPSGIYISEIYRCTVNKQNNEYVGYVETKVYNPQYENVRTIELYYMRSDSYIKAPPAKGEGANWQKTIPEETGDQIYIWQKTVTIYEDGREVVNSIVQIKGIPGEKGEAGVGQKEQLFLYAYTDNVDDKGSPIAPPIPSFPEETIIEITSIDTSVGDKGITKDDLVKVTGYYNDGTPIQYELSYDGDNLLVNISVPEGKEFTKATLFYYKAPSNWQFNTQPVTKKLPYQWKYTFIIYTDNTYVTDGPTLEAIWVDGIESIITQWAASDDGTNAPAESDESWTDNFKDVANTNLSYIWVREEITYKSTAVSHTDPRVDLANNAIKNWAISTDQTYINGAKIYTGTIDASKISVHDLSALEATIGGWTIGTESIYSDGTDKDNVLISAKIPPVVFINEETEEEQELSVAQRFAAGGKTLKGFEDKVKTCSADTLNYTSPNYTANALVYLTELDLDASEYNYPTRIKAYVQYGEEGQIHSLGEYYSQNEQWYFDENKTSLNKWLSVKAMSENSKLFKIQHIFNEWDSSTPFTNVIYEVFYKVKTTVALENPVFQLLSNGTGTIGGWDITQDGLSKVEWKDETKEKIEKEVFLTTSDNKKLIESKFGGNETPVLFSILDSNSKRTFQIDFNDCFNKDQGDGIPLPEGDGTQSYIVPANSIILSFTLPYGASFDEIKTQTITIPAITKADNSTVPSHELTIENFKTNDNNYYAYYQVFAESETENKTYPCFSEFSSSGGAPEPEIITYSLEAQCLFLANGTIEADGVYTKELKTNQINFSSIPGAGIIPYEGQGSCLLQGTWKSESSITVISDKRFKNSILSIPEKYSQVFDKLHPVIFKYNNGSSGRYHIGFIAQEVAQAVEEAGLDLNEFAAVTVGQSSGDSWGIRYEEFAALNVFEIQQLKARTAALEKQNQDLKEALYAFINGNKEQALTIINNG